jgi:hypothetical protein
MVDPIIAGAVIKEVGGFLSSMISVPMQIWAMNKQIGLTRETNAMYQKQYEGEMAFQKENADWTKQYQTEQFNYTKDRNNLADAIKWKDDVAAMINQDQNLKASIANLWHK